MQEKIIFKSNGKVVLHLPGKDYKPFRNIGTIDNGIFYTYRSSQKNQKYNHSNSIGFCYGLMRDYRHIIKAICVNHDATVLWSSPKAVFKYGTFKNFKSNDLELQIFMAIDKFNNSYEEALCECKSLNDADKPFIQVKPEPKATICDENQLGLFAIAS